jgi:hypothetical protein
MLVRCFYLDFFVKVTLIIVVLPLLLALAGWVVNVDFKTNVKNFFTIRADEFPRKGFTVTDSFKHGMKPIFIPAIGANLKDLVNFYWCHFFFHSYLPKNYYFYIYYSGFS